MEIPPELIQIFIGGGASGGLIYAFIEFMKARSKTRRIDEDTAISRLESDYRRKEGESRRGWALASWYREHYVLARDELPGEARQRFPPGPPADLEN